VWIKNLQYNAIYDGKTVALDQPIEGSFITKQITNEKGK
jgi:hypothetical protein